ncbi:MAG TPA: polysaccharide biosynthesis tyrosine autokinase [Sphingomicrobium sp.]
MNSNITVPNDGQWPVSPYVQAPPALGQRSYSPAAILDFPTLLRILHHWRWLVIGAVGLGLAAAILVSLLTKPVYRSWVTLEANPPAVAISDEQSREQDSQATNNFDFVATQVGLLGSRAVAERTAQELNLANNPDVAVQEGDSSERLRAATGTVQSGLKVVAPEQGQLIKFSFDSTSPQLAQLVANGVADSFINTSLQRRYEASAYARNFLERQIAKTRGDLEKSERAVVEYAQQQGIINTGSNGGTDGKTVTSGDTNSLQGESLVQLNSALAAATARRVAAEGAYREAVATGPTSDVNASVQPLRQQLATLQSEYQQKREFMKPEHPEMVSLQAQITELQRQISTQLSQASSGRLNGLLADYRAALSAEQALQARVGQLKGDVLNLRGRSIQYTILQREVDTNRSLYDALLQRYKQIGVAGGVGMAPVSIVDRAQLPTSPVKPNVLVNLIIGMGAGLLAGLAGAVGLEFLNDTIKTREDVRKKLSLPCLGTVPKTGLRDSFIDDLKNPTSMISEAYSAIVAALRFSTEDGMPKVLLVTSTRSGEGKSSTALAIAQNFARRERRVLLIDSDLRKPAFKTTHDRIGLSKLLTANDSLNDHVVETQHRSLWLLPSGPLPPNPADLLSTGRIRKIVAEAREAFDLVVIDGPPTLGLADAPLLASAAGSALFVIESGKTRTRAAIEALNRLEATGTRLVGAALTKSQDSGDGYGYAGYGYGYGYGSSARVKKTEILMIPKEESERDLSTAEADG